MLPEIYRKDTMQLSQPPLSKSHTSTAIHFFIFFPIVCLYTVVSNFS